MVNNRIIQKIKKTLRPLPLVAALTLLPATSFAADSVTTKTFKKLTEAQDLVGAEQVNEAYDLLKVLITEVKENSLDEALTLQMLGYTEMSRNNYPIAIDHFLKALAHEKLPEKTRYNIGYMVAQLYAAEGKFDKAIEFAREWFTTLEAPTPSQYIFMANILAQTKNYAEAAPYALNAIENAEKPKESWYKLLIACYFELKDYPNAEKYLKIAIQGWPTKPGYWEQLASVYLFLDNENSGLATLQLAWKQGILERKSSLQNLIQLSVNNGIPEHGARMLTQIMAKDLLDDDEKFLDVLANAWLAAKEFDKAVAAYEELGNLTNKAKPFERIASIYIQNTKWREAESAVRTALTKSPEKPGSTWYTLGITLTEQERFGEAIEAFRKAKGYPYTKKKANTWIGYAESLKRQKQWVEKNRQG